MLFRWGYWQMKLIADNRLMLGGILLALAGCGSFDGKTDGGPSPLSRTAPPAGEMASDDVVKLGNPFTIDGTTYTPANQVDYDDVGYASWYGDEFAGRPTANGERFNPSGFSAAHKTLPLPSYVEVTALDSGRTILVRVNDRGPMVNNRLIDLSQAAAEQLGIAGKPSAVRVRRVSPPESERAQLRAGLPVPMRQVTPGALLTILRAKAADLPAPTNAVRPGRVVAAPIPPSAPAREDIVGTKSGDRFIVEGGSAGARAAPSAPSAPAAATAPYVVQVAAYGSRARADAAARAVGGVAVQAGSVWRVRMGPFSNESAAQSALAKAKAKGYGDARIMRDQ